jgi:methylmalonyl-CoA mutase N-terminal domain/subunit
MFIVGINLWTSDHEDYYDFEYSGVEHSTREEAEEELAEAKIREADNDSVESIYIREV